MEKVIIMKNVKVVLALVRNLFSISTVMRNHWDLLMETTDDMKVLKIKKNDMEYKFDRKVSKNSNGATKWSSSKGICNNVGKTRAIMNGAGFDEKKRIYSGQKPPIH